MNLRFKQAMREWSDEVEAEAIRLINRGVPPYVAIEQGRNNVSRRRRQAANRREVEYSQTGDAGCGDCDPFVV